MMRNTITTSKIMKLFNKNIDRLEGGLACQQIEVNKPNKEYGREIT